MAVATFCCGFECGVMGADGQHWQPANGTATIETTRPRSDLRSGKVVSAGAPSYFTSYNNGNNLRYVGRA